MTKYAVHDNTLLVTFSPVMQVINWPGFSALNPVRAQIWFEPLSTDPKIKDTILNAYDQEYN